MTLFEEVIFYLLTNVTRLEHTKCEHENKEIKSFKEFKEFNERHFTRYIQASYNLIINIRVEYGDDDKRGDDEYEYIDEFYYNMFKYIPLVNSLHWQHMNDIREILIKYIVNLDLSSIRFDGYPKESLYEIKKKREKNEDEDTDNTEEDPESVLFN